jgi:hypothetical protein
MKLLHFFAYIDITLSSFVNINNVKKGKKMPKEFFAE